MLPADDPTGTVEEVPNMTAVAVECIGIALCGVAAERRRAADALNRLAALGT